MKHPPFRIRFWGVRGSIPAAGAETAKFGGNTPCIEVRCGKELIILDAGTGIRNLGNHLAKKGPVDATILLTHLHWDHVQGFPFFVPAYMPKNKLTLMAQGRNGLTLRQTLAKQMTYPYFPVPLTEMASKMKFRHFEPGAKFKIGAVEVHTFPTRHPQSAIAFRLDSGKHSLLYATDTEHFGNGKVDPQLLKAAAGVDCLIYDATFTDKEYKGNGHPGSSRVGWGHSTWTEGVRLAKAADAKNLILFHHDPKRTDKELASMERQAKNRFRNTRAAREGMVLTI